MSFSQDIQRFVTVVKTRNRAVFVGTANAIHESVKFGRPETGAPGQPVDTGFLQGSWTVAVGLQEAIIGTNVAYARVVEDNGDRSKYNPAGKMPDPDSPLAQRKSIKSTTGGAHSVKMTVAGANRLQAAVLREMGQ
jgi:phage gpG-like protein